MKRKVRAAGARKKENLFLFLLALLLVAPLVGCSKKPTADKWKDCINNWGWDTCRTYPRYMDYNATWSPDGKTIAYLHGGRTQFGDTSGIYLIDTTGNNRRVLVPSVLAVQPAFSPNGQWVAFANLADDAIYKIKINGDSLTQLTSGGEDQQPAWSPDGNWIAYVRASNPGGGLRIISPDQTTDSLLMDSGGASPDWSNDGSSILCFRAFFEQGEQKLYVGIFNLIDSTFRKLREAPFALWSHLRWNPDNSKILLTVYEPNNDIYVAPSYLYTMDSAGQSFQKLLTTPSFEGTWSPDGKKIVYSDTRPEYGTLFTMDADGRNKRQITLTSLPKKSPGR